MNDSPVVGRFACRSCQLGIHCVVDWTFPMFESPLAAVGCRCIPCAIYKLDVILRAA